MRNKPHIREDYIGKILDKADLCVACGLCLPHCPTYEINQEEGESPRGRIAMMRALTLGKLEATPKLKLHLNQCLSCRACERVCPANIPFAKLLEESRAFLNDTETGARKKIWLWGLHFFLTSPKALHALVQLLKFRQKYKLGERFVRTEFSLPNSSKPDQWKSNYPALGKERGRVALFLGCITKELDPKPLAAAIKVLTHLGYSVAIPDNQTCCGGLQLQQGDLSRAQDLAHTNINVFLDTPVDAIITVASGCGATLKSYDTQATSPNAKQFSDKVTDISAFLHAIEWPSNIELNPCNKKVTVHTPCTLRNAMGGPESAARLLMRLPGIELIKLPREMGCCGGAGLYPLEHPELASKLLDRQLPLLVKQEPDIIATSNIGCAIQLQSGLKKTNSSARVIHPIELIAKQLIEPSPR